MFRLFYIRISLLYVTLFNKYFTVFYEYYFGYTIVRNTNDFLSENIFFHLKYQINHKKIDF